MPTDVRCIFWQHLVSSLGSMVSAQSSERPSSSRETELSVCLGMFRPISVDLSDRKEHRMPRNKTASTKTIAESIEESANAQWIPVTYDNYAQVVGPFFHGTRVAFERGDFVAPGHLSNYHVGRVANNVYFAALLEPAIWAAEIAVALASSDEPARVYIVEPLGPFEDDPNVTNKKFPGNVTRSYRTREALRVVEEVRPWVGHPPEVLQTMVDKITRLREQGLDIIED
jgi:hypothetical protein